MTAVSGAARRENCAMRYQVRLVDVPGMEHALCPAKALREGLDFLEARTNAAAAVR